MKLVPQPHDAVATSTNGRNAAESRVPIRSLLEKRKSRSESLLFKYACIRADASGSSTITTRRMRLGATGVAGYRNELLNAVPPALKLG